MRSKRIAIRRRRRAPSRRTNAPSSLRRCSRHCSPILLRAAAAAAHRRGAPKTMMMIHVSLSHKIDFGFFFTALFFFFRRLSLFYSSFVDPTTNDDDHRPTTKKVYFGSLSIDRSIDRSGIEGLYVWNSLSLSLSLDFLGNEKKRKKNRNPKWSIFIILSFLSQKPDYSKKRVDSVICLSRLE